ncbi:hypothetical protein ABQG68_11920 [Bacillus pumilus]|uniref:hypothetical protein n=1 Tax=Bacillus pumilus TaxID=1408 RepID=UPI0033164543
MKKQIIAGTLALTTLFSIVAPVSTYAAENKKAKNLVKVELQSTVLQNATVQNELTNTINNTVVNDPTLSTKGLKKDALVYALRNGGKLLGDLLEILSKKNADYVKKYSKQIADFLDSVTNSIEARLIDFMIFELGIPASSARTIAWAIMFVIA